jgi:O-antigen/teichoic acid export membrane protein
MTTERPIPDGAAASTTAASVLRGSAWSLVARALPQAYVLILSIVAARYLGPANMGRQSYIAFVSLSATMVVAGGLSISLIRSVGETLGRGEPAAVRGLMRWAWLVAAVGAVLGGSALAGAAVAGADPASAWLLAAVGCSLGILQAIPSALLIGAQRWRDASIVGLVTGTVTVPVVIVVLASGGGITGMFAVEAAVAAVNLLWASVLARRAADRLSRRSVRSPELTRRTAVYAVALSANVILSAVVFKRSEFFFLDEYSPDSEIAIYSIAFAAVTALALLPEALTSTVVPAFATLFGAGEISRLNTGFARGLRMLALASLPITAAMLAMGPEALRLIYGGEYAGTEPVLRIMMVVFPVIPLLNVSYSLLIGIGRLRAAVISNGVAAAANVGLALALVPRYDAQGAAIANSAAQLVAVIAVLGYTRRLIGGFGSSWRSLALTLLAATVGGLAAYGLVLALPPLAGCVLGLAAGTVVFTGLARLLRILPSRDAEWLAEMAGERGGGAVARAIRVLAPPPGAGGGPTTWH